MAEEEKKRTNRGYWSLIIAAIVFGAFALIFFQNTGKVQLTLFYRTVPASVNALIFSCFLFGFLMGLFVMIPGRWRVYRSNRKLRKQLQQEIKQQKDRQYIADTSDEQQP